MTPRSTEVRDNTISEGRLVGQLMTFHTGRKRGITVRELARELTGGTSTSTERQIRQLVVDLRQKGVPVCSCPAHGYYMAASAEELAETCAQLHARAMTSLQQVAGLRRMALPELVGQLGLDDTSGAAA